jgi:hypothetical protein
MKKKLWSLPKLMEGLHEKVARDLKIARETLGHPVAKGDGSQAVWITLFDNHLPQRYRAQTATIVDSKGEFSEQIDVVLYDRQYSPFIFNFKGQVVIPAEAVYAAFEAKQEITKPNIVYSQKKIASVRRLYRTSAKVQTVDGLRPGKTPQHILGGFLAFDCRWKRPVDKTLARALKADQSDGCLDLGCIAAHGTFGCNGADRMTVCYDSHAATCFLLEIMTRLQECGTVPAIDFRAYSKWLT